ncbi:MAG: hypothetical protein IKO68_12225 [Oscillospiraceae bacterium]|nr:hypothetical protein [Oscillospiraceae bacterium]MBR6861747.1 hypothetical protein [Acidaminococcaceae bacterium]
MKNRIVALILSVLCLASLFAGCAKKAPAPAANETQSNQNPSITQEQSVSESVHGSEIIHNSEDIGGDTQSNAPDATESSPASHTRVTKEEQIAKRYVEALLNKNYEEALKCLASSIEPSSLVFTEDIEWALPRTEFKDLDYFDPETTEFNTSLGYGGMVSVSLKDGNGEHQTFSVATIVPASGDGTPFVDGRNSIYVESCTIRVPGNTNISINDVEIGSEMIKERRAGKYALSTDILFPIIGMKPKSLRIYCENHDSTRDFTPVAHNSIGTDDPLSFGPRYEDTDELHETIMQLWQDMYSAVGEPESDISTLNPFIASDAAPDTAKTAYDSLISLRNSSPAKQRDHRITQVVNRQDVQKQAGWLSDHVIGINFGYELTWTTTFGSAWDETDTMRRYSSIILAKEDGEWKLYMITDNNLFGYTNSMTHNW